jgi:RHS repeat-associated protein
MTKPERLAGLVALGTIALVLSCQGIEVEGLPAYGGVDEAEVSVALEDATVDSRVPNRWLGDQASLSVGPGVHTLMRTTETRATVAALVPPGSEIRQAVLRAHSSSGACATVESGIRVHRMTRSWLQESVTWNCRIDREPEDGLRGCGGSNAWVMGPVGLPFWIAPYQREPLSGPTVCDDGVYELDVTEDVIVWLEGTTSEHPGWLLAMNPGSDALHSTEALDFADRPELLIRTVPSSGTYVLPHPIPTPLDGSTVTHVWGAYRYLIEQRNQWPVSVSDIDPDRVALVRGRVIRRPTSSALEGLPGIRVIPVGRAELGSTRTHDDGTFELLVHGGGPILLRFEGQDGATDLLPAQRHIDVPWGGERVLPDLALVPEPPLSSCQRVDSSLGSMSGPVSSGTDDRGGRSLRVYVPPGASVRDGAGGLARDTYYLCGTEYTIDPPGTLTDVAAVRGEAAMPGELPDTSTFTFAAKVQVRSDSGNSPGADMASPIFDAPGVTFWLDNFLGFDVGTVIPYGYYDESRARWVTGPDGRVVSVTRDSPTTCTFDGATLDATESERACQGLGLTVGETRTFWRVTGARRFSPIDLNLLALIEFFQPLINVAVGMFDAFCGMGSIIRCDDQSLSEVLPIAGSPLALAYSSSRQRGRRDAFRASIRPLDRERASNSALMDVTVDLEVAGARETIPRPSGALSSSLEWVAEWDGLDAEDRRRQGPQAGFIHVGYVYDRYRLASGSGGSFAETRPVVILDENTPTPPPATPPGRYFTVWQVFPVVLGVVDDALGGAAGWNVDQHHTYDPAARTLWMGDGRRVRRETTGEIVHTLRGPRQSPAAALGYNWQMWGVATDDEGTVYVAISSVTGSGVSPALAGIYRVRRGDAVQNPMNPSAGVMERICSVGDPRTSNPRGIAVRYNGPGVDPTIYFTDYRRDDGTGGQCVRRIDVMGGLCSSATPVVGTCGTEATGTSVTDRLTGYPASSAVSWASETPTSVLLDDPEAIALTSTGDLLVSDPSRDRVLRLYDDGTPDGRIELYAGNAGRCDVNPLHCLAIEEVTALATGTDGRVLMAGSMAEPTSDGGGRIAPRIVEVTGGGLTRSVIGGAVGTARADGGRGAGVSLGRIPSLAITRNFEIVFSEEAGRYRTTENLVACIPGGSTQCADGDRVRIVDVQGRMSTFSGCRIGQNCDDLTWYDGTQAASSRLRYTARGIAVLPGGEVVYSDSLDASGSLRVVEGMFEGGRARRHYIPSDDGSVLWEFDPNGRHLRTLDAFTRHELLRFDYTSTGRVAAVRIEDRPPVTIDYGSIIAIDAWGTSTRITRDGEYSSSVEYVRDGSTEAYGTTFTTEGLLRALRTPRVDDADFEFDYDLEGRLESDGRDTDIQTIDVGFETDRFVRTGLVVDLTDADGFTTEYFTHLDPRNPRHETRHPSGLTMELRRPPGGTTQDSTVYDRDDNIGCVTHDDCATSQVCDHSVTPARCAYFQSEQEIAIDPRPEFGGQLRYPRASLMSFRDPLSGAVEQWPASTNIRWGTSAARTACNPRGDLCSISDFTSGGRPAGFALRDYPATARLVPPRSALPAVEVAGTESARTSYAGTPALRSTTHPENRVVRTVFDGEGRVTRVERPGQHPVCFEYATPRGSEPTRVWQSDECATTGTVRETRWTYYANRLPQTEATGTGSARLTTTFAYDGRAWPTTVTLPGTGRQVVHGFDANGNLDTLSVPGGRVHAYEYTSRDELFTETPPATTSLGAYSAAPIGTHSYSAAGRPAAVTPRGERGPLEWQYTSAEEDIHVTGVLAGPPESRVLSYDIDSDYAGRFTRIDGEGVNLSREYAGPYVRRESWSVGVASGSVATRVASTQLPESHTVQLDGDPARTITYGFNGDRELTNLSTPGGASQTTSVTYSAMPASMTIAATAGRVAVTTSFDGFGETSQINAVGGATASARYSVVIPERLSACVGGGSVSGRDALGRIRLREEVVSTGSTTTTTCDEFTYDTASRLGTWRRTRGACSARCGASGSSLIARAIYGYDANGNRTGAGFQSNEQDQPSSTARPRTYDERGRMVTRGTGATLERFSYDAFDRPVAVRTDTGVVNRYQYDGLGRLVTVTNRDGSTERYLYRDEMRPIAWQRETSTGAITTAYFGYASQQHVPDLAWVDEGSDGSLDRTLRLVTDERGSVRMVLDASTGAVVQTISYDPWGVPSSDTSAWAQPFGFAGGLRLAGVELWHFGMRDYDPTLGRFTTRDPIGLDGGLNLYMYAGGDPVNVIDPSGLFPLAAYLAVGCIANLLMNGGNAYEVGFAVALNLITAGLEGAGSLPRMGRGPGGCFSEGTPVETEGGLVDIAAIEAGDRVWALDEATGEWGFHEVIERTVHAADGVIALELGPESGPVETIEATREHPFWARTSASALASSSAMRPGSGPRDGWVPAGELHPGDEIFTSTGGWIRIHGNTWISREQLVYNLDVDGADTFFVGHSGAWVHNQCYDRHHVLPQQFRGLFASRYGINVDDFSAEVPRYYHNWLHSDRHIYGPGGVYNYAWDNFLNPSQGPVPTLNQVMDFAEKQVFSSGGIAEYARYLGPLRPL